LLRRRRHRLRGVCCRRRSCRWVWRLRWHACPRLLRPARPRLQAVIGLQAREDQLLLRLLLRLLLLLGQLCMSCLERLLCVALLITHGGVLQAGAQRYCAGLFSSCNSHGPPVLLSAADGARQRRARQAAAAAAACRAALAVAAGRQWQAAGPRIAGTLHCCCSCGRVSCRCCCCRRNRLLPWRRHVRRARPLGGAAAAVCPPQRVTAATCSCNATIVCHTLAGWLLCGYCPGSGCCTAVVFQNPHAAVSPPLSISNTSCRRAGRARRRLLLLLLLPLLLLLHGVC
jgi:hypothetical protein